MDIEILEQTAATYLENNRNQSHTATVLGIARSTLQNRLNKCGEKGLLGFEPVIEGFRVSQVSTVKNAAGEVTQTAIQQKPQHGGKFVIPEGHRLAGVSALLNPDGEEIVKWFKTKAEDPIAATWRDALDEFKRDLPHIAPSAAPTLLNARLLAQYTVTDSHFGMLAWAEETGDADYDLAIAEKLHMDWFTAAIQMAPNAHTAIFAQLGDLLHYDSMETKTPTSGHIVDGDSRPQKMVRVVIRIIRRVIAMLLAKHAVVKIIMAKGNHDMYSSAWLREILAAMYEDEPRLIVDTSPMEYYCHQHGKTALFYHHGHQRNIKNVDTTFVSMFREIYGACTHAYGHEGHLHSDEVIETNLMKIERHRTLAPSDAYSGGKGHRSGRDSKVIVYHDEFGEVSRLTISPEMVQGG